MDEIKPGALSKKTIAIALSMGALAALLVSFVIIGQKRAPHGDAGASAQLVDGGKPIALDESGHLSGVGAMPAEDAALLEQVLKQRRLPLALKPVALPKDEKVFAALSPLGEKTSNLPEFRWRKLEGAKGYRVEVLDASGQSVAVGDRVTATEWVVAKPLAGANEYTWTVRAETAAVQVDALPAEKKFVTMTAGDLAGVQEARSHGMHLLTAAVFARLGMRGEAEKELEKLDAENANSGLLKELHDSLQVPH